MARLSRIAIILALFLLALVGIEAVFPSRGPGTLGVSTLAQRALFVAALLAVWMIDGRNAPFRDEDAPWARRAFFAALALYAVWWGAALTYAIRDGNGYLAPAWAHAARHLSLVAAVAAALGQVVDSLRKA